MDSVLFLDIGEIDKKEKAEAIIKSYFQKNETISLKKDREVLKEVIYKLRDENKISYRIMEEIKKII